MSNLLIEAKNKACNLVIADFTYNPVSKQLLINNQTLDIEPRSIELLEVLLSRIGEPISGDEIIQRVWESEYISKNVLTNRISTLRALFKQHSAHPDAGKIIVTYPKKGYYLQTDLVSLAAEPASSAEQANTSAKLTNAANQENKGVVSSHTKDNDSRVGLRPRDESESESHPPKEPLTSSLTTMKHQKIHGLYLSLLLAVFVLFGWLYGLKQTEISPLALETKLQTELETRATVPVVDVLLNTIKAKDNFTQNYVKEIKARVLSQTLNYPFIDLKNQDSPTYFLDPIDDSIFWPGGRNVLAYDYKLNLILRKHGDHKINLMLELVYQGSNKLALKTEYTLTPDQIQTGLHILIKDLSVFLSLPLPEQYSSPDRTLSPKVAQTMINDGDRLIRSLARPYQLSRFETEFIARHAFLSDHLSDTDIRLAIDAIESSAKYPTEEVGIWLGLLHYKLEDYEHALEYLNKEQAYNKIHNAYLYVILSNMALKRENFHTFRLFYLRSVEALSEAIPSDAIFRRLAQPESKESCFTPWQSLTFSESSEDQLTLRRERFLGFCEAVEQHLKASLK